MENAGADGQIDSTRPAQAAPSPDTTQRSNVEAQAAASELDRALKADDTTATTLNRDNATTPAAGEGKNLRIPVLNVRAADLTDTFTDKRGAGTRLHEAIDIMAPKGTSVVAAAPGVVERMFVSDAGGKTIYVRSQDGLTIHYYAHLADYAEGLKEGQRVRRGQRLGTRRQHRQCGARSAAPAFCHPAHDQGCRNGGSPPTRSIPIRCWREPPSNQERSAAFFRTHRTRPLLPSFSRYISVVSEMRSNTMPFIDPRVNVTRSPVSR